MSEINWLRIGKEIANMPNGFAVLRVLQAHGVEHLVKFNEGGGVRQSCTIETVLNYAHTER